MHIIRWRRSTVPQQSRRQEGTGKAYRNPATTKQKLLRAFTESLRPRLRESTVESFEIPTADEVYSAYYKMQEYAEEEKNFREFELEEKIKVSLDVQGLEEPLEIEIKCRGVMNLYGRGNDDFEVYQDEKFIVVKPEQYKGSTLEVTDEYTDEDITEVTYDDLEEVLFVPAEKMGFQDRDEFLEHISDITFQEMLDRTSEAYEENETSTQENLEEALENLVTITEQWMESFLLDLVKTAAKEQGAPEKWIERLDYFTDSSKHYDSCSVYGIVYLKEEEEKFNRHATTLDSMFGEIIFKLRISDHKPSERGVYANPHVDVRFWELKDEETFENIKEEVVNVVEEALEYKGKSDKSSIPPPTISKIKGPDDDIY